MSRVGCKARQGGWLAQKPVDPLLGDALVVGVGSSVNLCFGVLRGAKVVAGSAPEGGAPGRSRYVVVAG